MPAQNKATREDCRQIHAPRQDCFPISNRLSDKTAHHTASRPANIGRLCRRKSVKQLKKRAGNRVPIIIKIQPKPKHPRQNNGSRIHIPSDNLMRWPRQNKRLKARKCPMYFLMSDPYFLFGRIVSYDAVRISHYLRVNKACPTISRSEKRCFTPCTS
ncbi:Uncharacterised protein [Neisseria meningitidis]|uniref:Uncharacterized protein n=1 Tax=Neisseria meningitidis TaxID=487 RepID=A0AAD2KNG1_NEIME|nr:Uncharacterised protein [Neisseria meningitidis]